VRSVAACGGRSVGKDDVSVGAGRLGLDTGGGDLSGQSGQLPGVAARSGF
jgi:hypothetical protein